jgi:hypothetical protein
VVCFGLAFFSHHDSGTCVHLCVCVCGSLVFLGKTKEYTKLFRGGKKETEREREREREEGQRIRMGLVGSDISQATCC